MEQWRFSIGIYIRTCFVIYFLKWSYCFETDTSSPWIWTKGCRKIRQITSAINVTENGPDICFRSCPQNTTVVALRGDLCDCRHEETVASTLFTFTRTCSPVPCAGDDINVCGDLDLSRNAWSVYERAHPEDLSVHGIPANATGCITVISKVGDALQYEVVPCNETYNKLCYSEILTDRCVQELDKKWSDVDSSCLIKTSNKVDSFTAVEKYCKIHFKWNNKEQAFWVGLFRSPSTARQDSTPSSAPSTTTLSTTPNSTAFLPTTNLSTPNSTTFLPTKTFSTHNSTIVSTSTLSSQSYKTVLTTTPSSTASTHASSATTSSSSTTITTQVPISDPSTKVTNLSSISSVTTISSTKLSTRTLSSTSTTNSPSRINPTKTSMPTTLKTESTATVTITEIFPSTQLSTGAVPAPANAASRLSTLVTDSDLKTYIIILVASFGVLILIITVFLTLIHRHLRGLRKDLIMTRESRNGRHIRDEQRNKRTSVFTDGMWVNTTGSEQPNHLRIPRPTATRSMFGQMSDRPSPLHSGLTARGREAEVSNDYADWRFREAAVPNADWRFREAAVPNEDWRFRENAVPNEYEDWRVSI